MYVQQVYCEPGQNRKIAALSMILCAHFFMEKNNMKDKIVNKLMIMNKKAVKNGDVPVSCIIVKNDKLISCAYNKKYKNNNPFDHAEIIAIRKACKKLKTSNLSDCEMYVSLFPCMMCQGAIIESRLKKIYYILEKEKIINDTIQYEHTFEHMKQYFEQEIKSFFKDKR